MTQRPRPTFPESDLLEQLVRRIRRLERATSGVVGDDGNFSPQIHGSIISKDWDGNTLENLDLSTADTTATKGWAWDSRGHGQVEGNFWVGGQMEVSGSLTIGGPATISGTQTVSGQSVVTGSLQVDGTATIGGDIVLDQGGDMKVVSSEGTANWRPTEVILQEASGNNVAVTSTTATLGTATLSIPSWATVVRLHSTVRVQYRNVSGGTSNILQYLVNDVGGLDEQTDAQETIVHNRNRNVTLARTTEITSWSGGTITCKALVYKESSNDSTASEWRMSVFAIATRE